MFRQRRGPHPLTVEKIPFLIEIHPLHPQQYNKHIPYPYNMPSGEIFSFESSILILGGSREPHALSTLRNANPTITSEMNWSF
uniref:Uncharacterized protein n=1 Tax=Colobus angolensis palliatus TaxID=336983 RepID=A0A2K5IAR3_COLAP